MMQLLGVWQEVSFSMVAMKWDVVVALYVR